MKDIEKLIREYLQRARMMQIATVSGDRPWICTVYFVVDDTLNLYWLSLPSRRHSQEIKEHSEVAVAIPIKFDQPVIGIQTEGTARVVSDAKQVARIMKLYVERYGLGKDFYSNFVSGKNQHSLYRFTPESFILFDEVNFKNNARQEWAS